jgi:hypothetical protein
VRSRGKSCVLNIYSTPLWARRSQCLDRTANRQASVLLGSFSNYLVTKSSVPVMVARKKLRKHAKYKNTNVRLSNNLNIPKRLELAKID